MVVVNKVLFGEDDNKIENVSKNNKFELNELGSGEVSYSRVT